MSARRTPAAAAAALAVVVGLGACGQKPASIRVNPAKQTIYGLKRTRAVTAEVLDKKGQPIPGAPIEWSSSKPTIAGVERTGAVKTVSPGRVTITARSGMLAGTATVEVVDAVEIAISPTRLTIAGPQGTTAALSAEVRSSKKQVVDAKPTWSSSNPKVVTIDKNGVLTAQGEGTATITAALGEVGGGCDIAVTFREIGVVELAPPTMILRTGESQVVRAAARDTRGAVVDDAAISWTSSDPAVASCVNGMVTGKAVGTATIRGACGGKTSEITVFVN